METVKCCKDLIGKTIAMVEEIIDKEYDDKDCRKITFTDGSHVFVSAYNLSFTGGSRNEYPVIIYFSELIESDTVIDKDTTLVITNYDDCSDTTMNEKLLKGEMI